jgi:hypothetical protein
VRTECLKGVLSALIIASLMVPLLLISAQAAWGQDIEWIRQFGTSDWDSAGGVAVDTSGVYVTGGTDGALPGQTSSGDYDAFVRKYDGSGNELWTRQFGSSYVDRARGVAVDGSGNAYVAGGTNDALPGQSSSGGLDAFLVKFVQPPSAILTVTATKVDSTHYNLRISHDGGDDLAVNDLDIQASDSSTTMAAYAFPGTGTFSVGMNAVLTCTYSPDCTNQVVTVYIIHKPSNEKVFISWSIAVQSPPQAPVGGVAFAPDKLALLAPYIILAALIAIGTVSVTVYWRRQGGKK